ncbi:hypothetical protein ACFL1Y_01770 [Patescibacteria group bacterium]
MSKISDFAEKYIDYYFYVYLSKIMIPVVCIRAWIGMFHQVVYRLEMIIFLIIFGIPFVVAIISSFIRLFDKNYQPTKKEPKKITWHIKEILKSFLYLFIFYIITLIVDVGLSVLGIIEINEATVFVSFFAILFTWPTIQTVWETIKTKGKNFILNNNDLKLEGGI